MTQDRLDDGGLVDRMPASAGMSACTSMSIAWLRWLVSDSYLETSWFTSSWRPAKALHAPMISAQMAVASAPFTMLVVAMVPGFTNEFISCPLYCSTATIELNTCPVASTPMVSSTRCAPLYCRTLASVKTFEID